MKPRPKFYILDAYSLIYQVFHAIPLMTSPSGQPTQAVFGIFRDLLNLIRDRKPDYLAAAFDGAGPVFRSDLFADYKAQRSAMPDDLVPQIPVIRRVFDGFRVPVLIHQGMEADDVIATLARRGEERGLDVYICTADKDARQLLGDHIRIYNLRKQSVLDVAALKADWGVGPGQVVDLLSLTGDTSDNVPGVPGIGLKTGAKLLEEFQTLDNLLANIDKVSGSKRKENLQAFAETARLARTLVTLRDDLELPLDWEALRIQAPDVKEPSASNAGSTGSSMSWPRPRGRSGCSGTRRARGRGRWPEPG
jgi:DNA polymerase-1